VEIKVCEAPANQCEIIHPKDYYVKFTGTYAQLKKHGYAFQKLHAANYQQWNCGDVRIWRKGQEVTHDKFGNAFAAVFHQLVKLGIEDLPYVPVTYFQNTCWLKLYLNKETYECTPDPSKYKQDRSRIWASFDKIEQEEAEGIVPTSQIEIEEWIEIIITPDAVKPLRELVSKNWATLEKINR
jgi:hypothetical protein